MGGNLVTMDRDCHSTDRQSISNPNSEMRAQSDRAVAGLLDFLTAMVIVMGAVTVYFTAAAVLIDVQKEQSTAAANAGIRVEERLVDDILRNQTGDQVVAAGCTRSFFEGTGNRSCGFEDNGRGQTFLRRVFGVSEAYTVNVTMEEAGTILDRSHTPGGTDYRHAIGEPTPLSDSVTVYYRTVTFGSDDDGDGRTEYYTVYVRLWEGT